MTEIALGILSVQVQTVQTTAQGIPLFNIAKSIVTVRHAEYTPTEHRWFGRTQPVESKTPEGISRQGYLLVQSRFQRIGEVWHK